MCVVYFFVIGQDANPDKATWIGRNGTIDKIKKGIEGHPQAQFEYILQDALDHWQRGNNHWETKRQYKLSWWQTSFHRLKVYRGTNYSYCILTLQASALLLVNTQCKEIGKDLYTITPVVKTGYRNLKTKIKKIREWSKGFTDVNSPWGKEWKNLYIHQLLIQFGSLPGEELEKLGDPVTKLLHCRYGSTLQDWNIWRSHKC